MESKHNTEAQFYSGMESITRLLPRKMANRRIFDRALTLMSEDVVRNKNNMLANYRYKMQECLRVLNKEYEKSIAESNKEIDLLFEHIERNHQSVSNAYDQTKQKLHEFLRELDALRL